MTSRPDRRGDFTGLLGREITRHRSEQIGAPWAIQSPEEKRRRLRSVVELSIELGRVRETTAFSTGLAELAIEDVIEGDWEMVEAWSAHFTLGAEDDDLRERYAPAFAVFRELLLQALRAAWGTDMTDATSAILPVRIVSGGQTGADRGGLDAAIDLHLERGGWAPLGWRAEDGVVPEHYRAGMQQAATPDWHTRTLLNIQHSDGTLVLSFAPILTGGSRLTVQLAARLGRPLRHVVLDPSGAPPGEVLVTRTLAWIDDHRIRVLNVAGPRESKEPGIQRAVRDALVNLLEDGETA